MIRCNSITTSQNINFQIDNLKIHLERYRYLKNLKINTKLLRFAENGILSSFLNLIFLIHKNKNYTFKYKRKIFADKLKKIMLKNTLPIFKKIILYIALKNNIYFDIIIVYIKKFCLNFK